ncbi:MAG: hypothetical protein IKT40_07500 [Bacilli bacterium]|nr:hypothetical protein [Bacilli bacterium]
MEILLNKKLSKKSSNVNNSLSVNLTNGKRLLPIDDLRTTINEIELYNSERESTTSIRLTCSVNTICSNVLFNNITEIVKNEGSDSCVCLNFSDSIPNNIWDGNGLLYKSKSNFGNQIACIRDTQLSNDANGFEYHCGLDIFNNHILRSNSFKAVCPLGGVSEHFNTIEDMSRTLDGEQVKGYKDIRNKEAINDQINLHLYLNEDILSFEECIDQRLIEENGWFGFKNRSLFETITDKTITVTNKEGEPESKKIDITINRVINNRKSCDFIDMYPSRDLFSFVPKYNKHRKRIEKNWHYFITYPSSSTTDVAFFHSDTKGLKIYKYDFDYRGKNGIESIKLTSITKHGLSSKNKINLYNSSDVISRNVSVIEVIDEYTFTIYKDGLDLTNENNIDLSFKRLINGEEVRYYVRIFSKLPNWKFSEEKPTEENMYKDGGALITKNQEIDFENHIGKLAYSKNIYNDDIAEIVFTDSIDIYGLKDNLGRPLTSIYLTILKNNASYEKWYALNNVARNLTDSDIEFSHCFSELIAGYEYDLKYGMGDNSQEESTDEEDAENGENTENGGESTNEGNTENGGESNNEEEPNVVEYSSLYETEQASTSSNIERIGGDIKRINGRNSSNNEFNPLFRNITKDDNNFYGDICYYSDSLLKEFIIQPICYRFNTAQREYMYNDNTNYNRITHDEIVSDDYDYNGFNVEQQNYEIEDTSEGYYYYPHYEIPIRTFDENVSERKPILLTPKITLKNGVYNAYTIEKHYFGVNDPFIIRIINGDETKHFNCKVTGIIGLNKFNFELINNNDNEKQIFNSYLSNSIIKIIKKDFETPSYAQLSENGTSIYRWRNVIQNGFGTNDDIETYPFTNGCLYVNKNINLYVKRQDPNGYAQQSVLIGSNVIKQQDKDNYYNEEEITC